MVYLRLVIIFVMASIVASCAWTPRQTRDTSTIDEIDKELAASVQTAAEKQKPVAPPESVTNALLPPLTTSAIAGAGEERFDVFVDDVEARSFFIGLVKGTSYNMVVHPNVAGTISLELSDVTISQVMDVVRDVYGYPYKKRGRMYQVMPSGLRSEVFQIDYLSLKRRGISETRVTNGNVSDAGTSNTGDDGEDNLSSDGTSNNESSGTVGTQILTETDSDFWSELERTLSVLIGSGSDASVVVSPQAGIVVVRAMANEVEIVRDYLRRAQLIMRRQVVLEAKIMEVELNEGFQSGINWSKISSPLGDSAVYSMTGSSPESTTGGIFGVAFDSDSFSGVIELLETQGSVQVLSSPRISTVNNQKAVIKVGRDEFFVTDISNTTTTSTGTTTNNPEVELTPFFSGIALDVTPQINDADEIILHIHPSISEVEDQTKVINLGGQLVELPVALSTIRETDSIVFARDKQVVVLGGLMQNRSIDSSTGTPLLGQLPLVGHLFSQQRNATSKSELVILLKPTIMGPGGLPNGLERSSQRFGELRQQLDTDLVETVLQAK